MDIAKLVQLFQNTLNENNNKEAENQLDQIHKIIGFLPSVLQIAMESSIELPVRQAAVIYFKNEVTNHWQEKDGRNIPNYTIHENDKVLIRNSVVDALVLSPDVIRKHLSVALNYVIKYDFPGRWTGIIDKIVIFLQSTEPNNRLGALIALLQLAKNYEYRSIKDKAPLLDIMKLICPILDKLMIELLPDNSEQSVLIQKTILKIIYVVTQYSLPLKLFTQAYFTQWMEIIRQVLDRAVPNEVNNVDIDERYDLPWYKAKKWALHIIVRIFDRYGPFKGQNNEYRSFGRWYVDTFSVGMIQVILKMLHQYNQNIYLPPRVLQQCINYLNTCVGHMVTWKILKPNISQIIEKVIFPLMCYTDEDDELWSTDPEEYVRKKFDFFEDYVSPVTAAQQFLCTCCKKRKDMLKNTITFSIQVLSSPQSTPQFKDGALHMLGSVSDIMLRKKIYHQQINEMLTYHVFPYFNSDKPFLRARAAWILHFFEDFEFDNDNTLFQAINYLQCSLIQDQELPVKVQAAISLQILLINQEKTKSISEQTLEAIILECINLIKISQNDEVSNNLQRMICFFGEKMLPIAERIVKSLVSVLEIILQNNTDLNDNTITAMGILNTIDTLMMFIEEKELFMVVEPYALKAVLMILGLKLAELYEECFTLATSLTDKYISSNMWEIYHHIFQISTKEDGVTYFTDMLPTLHNFLTIDPDSFISDPSRIQVFYEICKAVLTNDTDDDAHGSALKMIEVFFLQHREKIANFISMFCELVYNRYCRDGNHSGPPSRLKQESRILCVQILLVVLYVNTDLFFQVIAKLQQTYMHKDVLNELIEEWLLNMKNFTGLHDRKVCILALCKLLTLPGNLMPPKVLELAPKAVPDLLTLFDNLKEAYKAKASADADSSDTDSEYSTSSDEEDCIDEDHNNDKDTMDDSDYTATTDDEDDLSDNDNELTTLENYETTIDKDDSHDDEYVLFRNTVQYLKQQDPNFYNLLFENLTSPQMDTMKDIFILAQRRQDAAESRKIEQGGGYVFSNQTIPTTFNFGGNPIN